MGKHRKTRRIYDEALTYEKIYSAWNTVSHTCKNKQGLFEFSMFAQARVEKILEELKAREYYPNKYRCFMIFEPKPRLVMSQSIKDKTVNHFVAREYLLPLLEPALIDTNVATRKKMGSSYAMKMVKRYIAQMTAKRPGAKIYALKIDVSKFFYRIDHEILFQKLKKRVKDKDVLEILRRIMDETNKPYINQVIDMFNQRFKTEVPHYELNKGLSIGAMTSQFLAIYYLNDLDHYIKEKLKCSYYIRYMDDFLFFSYDKEELRVIYEEVTRELEKLKLKVNPKSAIYNCCGAGFSFLGYRYFIEDGNLRIKCLSSTTRRIRRRLKLLEIYDYEKFLRSREAYKGYFLHGEGGEEGRGLKKCIIRDSLIGMENNKDNIQNNRAGENTKKGVAEERDYEEWMSVKRQVHNGGRFRTFSEGQIWWCVMGENVGVEINGKGNYFLRPVYIFKKNGRLSFAGIPLTTKAHEGYGYIKFRFKDRETYAVLSQYKTISVFRLLRKMGEADDQDIEMIRGGLGKYLGFL